MEEFNLIDRDKAIENIEQINCVDYGPMFSYEAHSAVKEVLRDIIGTLESTPPVEVVKHGRWVMDTDPDDGDCRCSNCHLCIGALHRRNHGLLKVLGYQLNTFYKYCPSCGAKMDLKSSIEL